MHTRLDEFIYHFEKDLESWFSADIACCDHCHDDFLAVWPHADSADNFYFQTKSIDADSFYSGSRLRTEFSQQEFDFYITKISCPRCGAPLGGNMWAYELPFDVPRNFESTIEEVSTLAKSTPFLLLEHEFCARVLDSIKTLFKTVAERPIDTPLFRARSLERGTLEQKLETFEVPPHKYVQEGRYNHAGNPVLYLASDKNTCQAELRGDECLIFEFILTQPIRVLDISNPFDAHEEHADLLNCLVYSALVSAKQNSNGWHRPHYVVSRFVADCARAAGFDAIKYPSTRITSTNFNLAILNPNLTLSKVAKSINFHHLAAVANRV